jgi:hypothetical protein
VKSPRLVAAVAGGAVAIALLLALVLGGKGNDEGPSTPVRDVPRAIDPARVPRAPSPPGVAAAAPSPATALPPPAAARGTSSSERNRLGPERKIPQAIPEETAQKIPPARPSSPSPRPATSPTDETKAAAPAPPASRRRSADPDEGFILR